MKTYPIRKDDGTLHAFEITSSWTTFRPLLNLLRGTDGVSDVQRRWFNQEREAWIGWIQEVPGVNCEKATRSELLESLQIALAEAIKFNGADAINNASMT